MDGAVPRAGNRWDRSSRHPPAVPAVPLGSRARGSHQPEVLNGVDLGLLTYAQARALLINPGGPVAAEAVAKAANASAKDASADEVPEAANNSGPSSSMGGVERTARRNVTNPALATTGPTGDERPPPGSRDDAGAPDAADAGGSTAGMEGDPALAAAIEASLAAQTEDGRLACEDDLLSEALRLSRLDEERRQRAALRHEQEEELRESVLADAAKAEAERRKQAEAEERDREEARERSEAIAQQEVEQAEKRSRIPPEPPANELGRVDLQVRGPSGGRLRRAFSSSCTIGQVYDYVDVEGPELAEGRPYRLVMARPRQVFEDRSQRLDGAGLVGQCAMLVERVD